LFLSIRHLVELTIMVEHLSKDRLDI